MDQSYDDLAKIALEKNKQGIVILRQIVDLMIKNNVPNDIYKDYFMAISNMNNAAINLERKLKTEAIKQKFGNKTIG